MLDSTIVFLSAFIAPICTLIGMYVLYKKVKESTLILDIFEDIMEDVAQNEDLQKKIYVIGGILGNGIRQGVGFNRGKGKLKLEDLVMQFVSGYIQKNITPNDGSVTPQQPAELPNPFAKP